MLLRLRGLGKSMPKTPTRWSCYSVPRVTQRPGGMVGSCRKAALLLWGKQTAISLLGVRSKRPQAFDFFIFFLDKYL